jgi:hypothetical protein
MEQVSNNIWYFLGAIGFSALISFGFFSAGVTNMQKRLAIQAEEHQIMQNQIDSLENVINTEFKNRRDTIIIKVSPQAIKYYHYSK